MMEAYGTTIPVRSVEKANEAAQRLRKKRRDDMLVDASAGGPRRHKERTALGTLSVNNGASQSLHEESASCTSSSASVASSSAVSTRAPLAPISDIIVAEDPDLSGFLNTSASSISSAGSQEVGCAALSAEAGPAVPADIDAVLDSPLFEVVKSTDPNDVPEYIDDIYNYLRQMEVKFMAKPRYMRKQRDINHSMRAILVDWLVEVAQEYRLDSQTLYIAVGYIDRFLSEMSVQRGKLQLVGVTAMLLAAKYEEIYPPAVDEFVYITDNTYSREQILKMEHLILKVLKFDMGGVTAYSFYQRYVTIAKADETTKYLTMYLIELTLQDGERYLHHLPSVVAASALCMALITQQKPCWSPALEHYSGLSLLNIRECVMEVYFTFAHAASMPQQAVREKFSHNRYRNVSSLAPPSKPPQL